MIIKDFKNFKQIRKTKDGYIATLWNGISFEVKYNTAIEISQGWKDYFAELELAKANYCSNVGNL